MTLDKVVANVVQRIEHRFFGKYQALVVDNADPEQLGRLKVRVLNVLGQQVVTGWAMPCVPYGGDMNQGLFFIPEVGAGVWVEFEAGDLEFPIWVGTFWSKPGGNSELPKPNGPDGAEQSSVQDPPTRKIIKTLKGHTIQLEDADGEEMVLIVEAVNGHVVTLNADGVKVTEGKNGHEVILDASGIKVTDAANGNEVMMDDSGVKVTDKNGNSVMLDSSGVSLADSNGNSIAMNATSGFLAGPGVDINGGTRVCLEGLINWLLSHTHVGNMGAPTPLSPNAIVQLVRAQAAPGSSILSDSVKVK